MLMRLVCCVIVAVVLATVNAAAMPVGCGGSPSPGTGASMTTTPSSLSFSSSGSGTSSQSMSLDPSGWIVDRFQVSGSQSWVTATVPSQGGTTTGVCDAQGNCGAISVSVDSTGLSAGTHTAAVLINPQYLDSCEGNQSF